MVISGAIRENPPADSSAKCGPFDGQFCGWFGDGPARATRHAHPHSICLTYPHHIPGEVASPDFATMGGLHFEEPQRDRFPAVDLGYAAAAAGGVAPTVMNAANEIAVDHFLQGHLPFTDIMNVVAQAIDQHQPISDPTLDDILASDAETRQRTQAALVNLGNNAAVAPLSLALS